MFSVSEFPVAHPVAVVSLDQHQTWPQLAFGQMYLAMSDVALKAAPTPAWDNDIVVVGVTTSDQEETERREFRLMLTGLCQVEVAC